MIKAGRSVYCIMSPPRLNGAKMRGTMEDREILCGVIPYYFPCICDESKVFLNITSLQLLCTFLYDFEIVTLCIVVGRNRTRLNPSRTSIQLHVAFARLPTRTSSFPRGQQAAPLQLNSHASDRDRRSSAQTLCVPVSSCWHRRRCRNHAPSAR